MRAKSYFLCLTIWVSFACNSTGNRLELAAMKPVELSYVQLAKSEVQASKKLLTMELEAFLKDQDSDGRSLSLALQEWQENLSFFVHLFPRSEQGDLHHELLNSANYGRFLLREEKRGDHQIQWAKTALKALSAPHTQLYLQDLNSRFATRRKGDLLPRAYWYGVNFIPDPRASFSSNFHDYLKAQKKALALEVQRALQGNDPLFPGQNLLVQNIRDRSSAIIHLEQKFLPVRSAQDRRNEIVEIHNFYSDLLVQLDRHAQFLDLKEASKASVLGRKIQRQWLEEQRKTLVTSSVAKN